MIKTLNVVDVNGVLTPNPIGPLAVTVQINTLNDSRVATIAWGGRMVGVVTKDLNNFLVSIQVLDTPNDSVNLYRSLENIGNAI